MKSLASDKLRALYAEMDSVPVNDLDVALSVAAAAHDALPLIADVVEAAERLADDADYAACYPEGAVGFEDLKDSKDKTYSTLTALNEHLDAK